MHGTTAHLISGHHKSKHIGRARKSLRKPSMTLSRAQRYYIRVTYPFPSLRAEIPVCKGAFTRVDLNHTDIGNAGFGVILDEYVGWLEAAVYESKLSRQLTSVASEDNKKLTP
jgi:hypothetical protein